MNKRYNELLFYVLDRNLCEYLCIYTYILEFSRNIAFLFDAYSYPIIGLSIETKNIQIILIQPPKY